MSFIAAATATTDDSDDTKEVPVIEFAAADMSLAAQQSYTKATRFEERAADFRHESERLRQYARDILEQADRVDERAVQMDKKSKSAHDQREMFNIQTDLFRLENDPNLNDVDTGGFYFGYGKALGKALLQTSNVITKLTLDFPTFFPKKYNGSSLENILQPMLLFLETNSSLQVLHVYDSKGYDTLPCIPRAATLILDAISKNKHIQELDWTLRAPPLALRDMLIQKTHSIRKMDLNVCSAANDLYSNEAELQMLAAAFGTLPNLEILWLSVPSNDDLTEGILRHLPKLPSLRELSLGADNDVDFDEERCFDAVSQFLNSSNGLRRFELNGVFLTDSAMAKVIAGLVGCSSDGDVNASCTMPVAPSITLSELALTNCGMDREATERLAAFLQTPTENTSTSSSTNSTPCLSSALRKLGVHAGSKRRWSSLLAASLLPSLAMTTTLSSTRDKSESSSGRASTSRATGTVGSQLESLCIACPHAAFFHLLKEHCIHVQLETLQMPGLSHTASVALSKCLPKLSSVRTVSLCDIENASDGKVVPRALYALLRNGSVVQVDTKNSDGVVSDFTTEELRLVQAFCHRNEHLGSLLATATRLSSRIGKSNNNNRSSSCTSQCNDAAAIPNSDTVNVNAVDADKATVDLNRSPALLTCAQRVTETRSALVLRGLLVIGECCAPQSLD